MKKHQKIIDNQKKIQNFMKTNFKNQSSSIEKVSKPQKETCQKSKNPR